MNVQVALHLLRTAGSIRQARPARARQHPRRHFTHGIAAGVRLARVWL